MITGREIGERFIRAVQIMEGLYHVGPGGGSGSWMAIPYTQADKNGWGSERLAAERQAFWNSINNSPRPWEVTEAEETMGWLSYVDKQDERLCLAAWARCMATDSIFKDWCKLSDIHPETGRRRKERAILRILLHFNRKAVQHSEIDVMALLPDEAQSGHKGVSIGEEGLKHWLTEGARPTTLHFDTDLINCFDWAEKQKARRRQRDQQARKRQAA